MQSHAAQYTGLCESEEQMSSVSDQLQRNVGKSCHTAVKGDKEMCGEANERKGDRQRGGKKRERKRGRRDNQRWRKGRNDTTVRDTQELCQL